MGHTICMHIPRDIYLSLLDSLLKANKSKQIPPVEDLKQTLQMLCFTQNVSLWMCRKIQHVSEETDSRWWACANDLTSARWERTVTLPHRRSVCREHFHTEFWRRKWWVKHFGYVFQVYDPPRCGLQETSWGAPWSLLSRRSFELCKLRDGLFSLC